LEEGGNTLHRVDLLTGKESAHKVLKYQFERGCRWTGLPGGSLLITGGSPEVRMVNKVDTLREFSVSALSPMSSERSFHAAVYYSQYLYVLGGYCGSYLRECERYSCAESRWEVLPALPVAGACMSAVELENSLYALGRLLSGTRSFSKLWICLTSVPIPQVRLPSA
jgi:hypothetical protein